MSIYLRVEAGAGMTDDTLEACFQLAVKLNIPVKFEGNDSEFVVFPYVVEPGMSPALQHHRPTGKTIQWMRAAGKWIKQETEGKL